MARSFFKFAEQEHLLTHVATMSAGQILALCIFHSRLSWQKGKPVKLRETDQFCIPKPTYTPASLVQAHSPPHFVKQVLADAAETGRPAMQPPQKCCLCGKGFLDPPALWAHCEAEHHSWAEAAKRILWEAEQLENLPVLPPDKRRIIQNFTAALTYSKPAEGHFGRSKACMRQLLGCAVCAKVEWMENCFPCYLFKVCPAEAQPKPNSDSVSAPPSDASDSDDEAEARDRRKGSLLRGDDGYYVIDAHAIHKLLDVNNYIQAWPRIPPEELHASSVQHPLHPQYRWLLNTRRVPTRHSENRSANMASAPGGSSAANCTTREGSPGVATEQRHTGCGVEFPAATQTLPRCAGVACADEPVWLCKMCTSALCRPKPVMPFFALSNWNWGGRLHPLFYNLSIAMQALLGLAIMVCRLVVLRYSDHPDDQEKGFVGNTILLAQPRPEEIKQALPPPNTEIPNYLSVCFNSQTISPRDVGAQKALEVDPAEYISCTELRRKVCPVFADVELDAEQVRRQWPEKAVPAALVESAQAMDTLHTFTPTMDGPASMRAATCQLPSSDAGKPEVVAEDDGAGATEHGDGAGATEHGDEHRDQSASAAGLHLDTPAEYLIGVQEDDAHDPVDRMIMFQKNLELVHEVGARLHHLEQARQRASGVEEAASAGAALAAARAQHAACLVDLRSVAAKMGHSYQQEMQEALASARMEDATANTPKTLRIKSGKPVNMFEPASWAAAFVQFFYGDCAPNLDRPRNVRMRDLFAYLAQREELEYVLESDANDPLIAGGCYRAPPHSRWNTPEFMAVFADVVRKVTILQTTQHMWRGDAPKWALDIKAICGAKVEHFEKLSRIIACHGQQSMAQIMHAAAEHKLLPLFKALQYVTFQTANIPLTQGYKMSLRQLGYGLNVYDGSLSIFSRRTSPTCTRPSLLFL